MKPRISPAKIREWPMGDLYFFEQISFPILDFVQTEIPDKISNKVSVAIFLEIFDELLEWKNTNNNRLSEK